jgi:hypothetical protein
VDLDLVEKSGLKYAEGIAGKTLMANAGDAMLLIGYCLERRIDRVLLYTENLADEFFRLSSGEAGDMLQKFRIYGLKVAAVLTRDKANRGKFAEMVAEENRGSDFHVFYDRTSAEEWLKNG